MADPGTRWEYGTNTDWLGMLVEKVSGQSLEDYFRQRVFEPLGMNDTSFEVPAGQAVTAGQRVRPQGGRRAGRAAAAAGGRR